MENHGCGFVTQLLSGVEHWQFPFLWNYCLAILSPFQVVVTFESADERLKYGKEVIFFDYVVPLLILASQNTET